MTALPTARPLQTHAHKATTDLYSHVIPSAQRAAADA